MQDLLDDLIELKKNIITKKIAAENENVKEIYKEVQEELSRIILEHEEWSVPFWFFLPDQSYLAYNLILN